MALPELFLQELKLRNSIEDVYKRQIPFAVSECLGGKHQ